ncbi:unnamed protein product [Ostreobium quekettii]|uniref:type I protein arginine methyltransferase n=1 Tax=Ostreobium quekettii TaxID=121088 RepID=A0A8S1IXX0_9CHLO|nr:unnamed protein product [Ostreobium quekettii]|eukprot:evm.model.scf_943.2 EVM.evm.TU.scf_943.2   scf_943:30557-35918(+)
MDSASDTAGEDDGLAASWDDWVQGTDDEDDGTARSLFSNEQFPSAEAAIEHDAQEFGFDIVDYVAKTGLDEFGAIKLVNYLRSEVQAGREPLTAVKEAANSTDERPWNDDSYLIPTVRDDALLRIDYQAMIQSRCSTDDGKGATMREMKGRLEALDAENMCLREAFQQLKSEVIWPEVSDIVRATGSMACSQESTLEAGNSKAESLSALSGSQSKEEDDEDSPEFARRTREEANGRVDASYFDSYSCFEIHKAMLSDQVRTKAYQNALQKNSSLVKGKVVLDVGCGTGILSLFACRAGAAQVIAVDGSTWAVDISRKAAAKNGYMGDSPSATMKVLSGKLENLPVMEVDVIISEWMGYGLLFESMLDTVLWARDRWLKPGGALLPDRASLFLAGTTKEGTGLDFWEDVYGFDMSAVADDIRQKARGKVMQEQAKADSIMTESVKIMDFDLMTMSISDVEFTTDFRLPCILTEASEMEDQGLTECHALALWFDVDFSSRFCSDCPVNLTTSPMTDPTHWGQSILLLKDPIKAKWISGRISMVRSDVHRGLDISLEYWPEWEGKKGHKETAIYSV